MRSIFEASAADVKRELHTQSAQRSRHAASVCYRANDGIPVKRIPPAGTATGRAGRLEGTTPTNATIGNGSCGAGVRLFGERAARPPETTTQPDQPSHHDQPHHGDPPRCRTADGWRFGTVTGLDRGDLDGCRF